MTIDIGIVDSITSVVRDGKFDINKVLHVAGTLEQTLEEVINENSYTPKIYSGSTSTEITGWFQTRGHYFKAGDFYLTVVELQATSTLSVTGTEIRVSYPDVVSRTYSERITAGLPAIKNWFKLPMSAVFDNSLGNVATDSSVEENNLGSGIFVPTMALGRANLQSGRIELSRVQGNHMYTNSSGTAVAVGDLDILTYVSFVWFEPPIS